MASQTVSVVIPTYNRLQPLLRAVGSVVEQTRPADEIIVVDDGSTDGSAQALHQRFPNVTVLVQENRGVSAARNVGTQHAGGAWIAFLDSDDEWLPRKLERQLQALQRHHESGDHAVLPRLCHTDEIWIRDGVRVNPMKKHAKRGGFIFDRCLLLCCISPSSALLHRSVFDDIGWFDETLPACEDYDLWLRFCAREPVLYVDELLLKKYGGHADQLSRQHWGMDRFRVQALEKLLGTGDLTPEQRAATLEVLKRKASILATGARKRGRIKEAEDYERRFLEPA